MLPWKADHYVKGVMAGDRRVLAKAITLVESDRPEDAALARIVLEKLQPVPENVQRLGVTGPPGVGKSTFIEALGMRLVSRGQRVAVLAIDPSSTRSSGSILGDKTRMTQLAARSEAFIRPSPAGVTLGGVARKTAQVITLVEAAGFDPVLVETVGTGQSDTVVAGMVDCLVLLVLPNSGDALQGIKRGIMELADVVVVNKADGSALNSAGDSARMMHGALALLGPHSHGWMPPVLLTSALHDAGMEPFLEEMNRHQRHMAETGEGQRKRQRQATNGMWEGVHDALRQRFIHHKQVRRLLPDMERQVIAGIVSPAMAVDRLLLAYGSGETP